VAGLIPLLTAHGPARHTVVGVETSVGDRGVVATVVTDADTALALGSGGLAVLGTPRLLAWCEAATCRALEGRLPSGSSSVGTAVALEHLTPSPVGETVTVVALVRSVEGRRIGFTVEAVDAGRTVVGRGTVERMVVDDERFLARLARDRS
jgi:predicted thioesterase